MASEFISHTLDGHVGSEVLGRFLQWGAQRAWDLHTPSPTLSYAALLYAVHKLAIRSEFF